MYSSSPITKQEHDPGFSYLIVISPGPSTMPSRCSTNINELPVQITHDAAVDRHCQPEKHREGIIKDGLTTATDVSNRHEIELANSIAIGKPHAIVSWSQWGTDSTGVCPMPIDYTTGRQ